MLSIMNFNLYNSEIQSVKDMEFVGYCTAPVNYIIGCLGEGKAWIQHGVNGVLMTLPSPFSTSKVMLTCESETLSFTHALRNRSTKQPKTPLDSLRSPDCNSQSKSNNLPPHCLPHSQLSS